MTSISTVEQLLDALDETRERLLLAIEPLEDEELLQKGALGDWSVVDLLSNLTAWESELVTGIMKLDQMKRPVKLLDALADPHGYDKAHFEEMQNRDLDQVFDDLQQVRVQLEDWISGFSENDLTNPRRYQWLGNRPLKEIIAQATFQREATLIPRLEQYTEQVIAEADQNDFIPLGLVSPAIDTSTEEEADESTN
ncbi:MAG: ClbS/DfsB family four-helix bundle protein [Candidatus Promineifilaceae bacterium]|jgi:hypothetical protein